MMIYTCPTCGIPMFAVCTGWLCPSCKCFVDMQGNVRQHKEEPFMPPQTNGDRMRSMNDEAIAKDRTRLVSEPEEDDGYENDVGWFTNYDIAIEREIEWLGKEAQNDTRAAASL